MPLFDEADLPFVRAVSDLIFCNPFLPQRIEAERRALGDAFVEDGSEWNVDPRAGVRRPNVEVLCERATQVVEAARQRLVDGYKASASESDLYGELVLFCAYHAFNERFEQAIEKAMSGRGKLNVTFYKAFAAMSARLIEVPGVRHSREMKDYAHCFAVCFQLRRAFHHIFRHLIGASKPMIALRADVWQSIFTCDQRRYYWTYFKHMVDITTLVMGPSGTGKELVARAIGLSRYVPFDPAANRFVENFTGTFHALNLSAFSPTLIESELFGHQRGSFTGAVADRAGWLELCEPLGTVFLDEVGELDHAIQVKLLRVLQSRQFQRIGDSQTRMFRGKIIAATNRDLAEEIRAGRFRTDFYYRLCADVIRTPSLAEQLQDTPDDLSRLVRFLAERVVGEEAADDLAAVAMDVIDQRIGPTYRWPGNVRELEQCVRNVMIRRDYRPAAIDGDGGRGDVAAQIARQMREGQLSADELLSQYCTLVYSRTRNYQETARRVGLDRRTVKARIDASLLSRLDDEALAATNGR